MTGYGYIYRITFTAGSGLPLYILKQVEPPPPAAKDDNDEGTMGKLASYKVEVNLYECLTTRFNTTVGSLGQVQAFVA